MKKLILPILCSICCCMSLLAVPANPRPLPYVQPNGDTIIIRVQGDEHFHFRITEDGYLIEQNDNGYYCYAKWKEVKSTGNDTTRKVAVPTRKKAHNEAKRSKCEKRWLVRHKIPKKG